MALCCPFYWPGSAPRWALIPACKSACAPPTHGMRRILTIPRPCSQGQHVVIDSSDTSLMWLHKLMAPSWNTMQSAQLFLYLCRAMHRPGSASSWVHHTTFPGVQEGRLDRSEGASHTKACDTGRPERASDWGATGYSGQLGSPMICIYQSRPNRIQQGMGTACRMLFPMHAALCTSLSHN